MKDYITKTIASFEKDKRLPLIAASVVLLLTSYKVIKVASNSGKIKSTKEIPAPKERYPFVGHMLSLGDIAGKTVEAWHDKLGPIIKLQMGVQTWIMVADPALAHKIFVTNGAKTSLRFDSFFTFHLYSRGGKGVAFAQPSPKWKVTRAKVQAGFVPKQIDPYLDAITFEAQQLTEFLIDNSEKENGIMPFEYIKWFSTNNIFSLVFAKRFLDTKDPEFLLISDISEMTSKQMAPETDLANFFPVFSFIDYFTGERAKLRDFVENVRNPLYLKNIKNALNSDKPNIMKSIKENNTDWTDDEYLGFISDMIAGGTDTISVSLMWFITLMANFQKSQKTVANEIDDFIKLNERLPNFTERTEMPYLLACIKESLRLNPSTQFGVGHVVEEDIEVDGYILKKGYNILSSMHGMHLGPHYDQPKSFMPERFLEKNKTMFALQNGRLEDRDQFNFGWGRRICPGTYLAEAEIFTALVQIFSQCTVKPPPEGMPDITKGRSTGINVLPLICKLSFDRRASPLVAVTA